MTAFQEEDYTKRFDLSLWKKLLKLAKPFHKNLWIIAITMVLSAGVDVALPMMNSYAIDHFIAEKTSDGLVVFGLLYVMLIAMQVGFIFLFIRESGKVETGMCYHIRQLGFRKLQELPFAYYDRMPVGSLMSRLTNDTQRLGDTIGWSLVDLCWGVAFLVLCSIQMLILNAPLALAVMLVLPPLALVSWRFQKGILQSYRQVRKRNSQLTSAFNEGINGAKTTKTLVREELNNEEFHEIAEGMRKSAVRAATLSALFLPIVVSLGSLATAWALLQGSSQVLAEKAGQIGMTVGVLQAFISYTLQFFQPVQDVARIFAELQSSQAAAERVLTLLDTQPAIVDTPEVEAIFGDNFHPKKENWPALHGDIDFEDVSFKYQDGEKVLEHFNLSVKAGQTIALVGETGSGKSTIVNLVCRFYEPTEGRVLIDHVDYRQRSQLWLQSNLGYVLQTPHLFSGTIADNIRYGRPDATDDEVHHAARMVGAEPFILGMQDGYDTQVGEGGGRLSTGQKQLVSFARALLTNPAIFVLDEATSSVDTETERLIQQAIQTTLEGRTSFIIAHRLSTIRSADRILLIHDGKIVEDGTHRQLLAKRGEYYRLYTNQFRDEAGRALLEREAQTGTLSA
ncbi:MAG: ABC transporter ATP-binding protein [Clostridia bacterium]|nr:ABC transporter ATP-binding protein [Clostridia bacterium]